MGGGCQRWGACVVGAGWGIRHSSLFAKSRLLTRTDSGIESERPPGKRALWVVFFAGFGWNSVSNLSAGAGLDPVKKKPVADFLYYMFNRIKKRIQGFDEVQSPSLA